MAKSKNTRRGEEAGDRDFVRSILVKAWTGDEPSADTVVWSLIDGAEDPGGDLASLAAYDLDTNISHAAVTVLLTMLTAVDVPEDELDALTDSAAPVLLQALQDPGLPDERKYWLGPVYAQCGGELSPDDLQAFFKDYEGVCQRNLKELIAEMSDQPSSVRRVIESLVVATEDEAPGEAQVLGPLLMFCADLADSDPSAAAATLGAGVAHAMATGAGAEHALAALDEIVATRCPRAAWSLAELGAWPGLHAVGARAGQLATEMVADGVTPRANVLSDFSHGLVTSVDGSGARGLHLFHRTPEGGMDAINLMLHDSLGVKDAWYLDEEGAEVERVLRERDDELTWAPCTVELARELVADAWALQAERDEPFPWQFFICRPCLGSEPIEPRRRKPNLGAYMLEITQRAPDLFDGSERLTDYAIYGGLFFASDEAYAHVEKVRPKRGRQRLSAKKLDVFIREIAIQERDTLLARMAANLEVESVAGRATQRHNRVAARTWLGLTENILPFHKVPFIRELAAISAETIIENLGLGYRSQAEADRAALEMELGFGDELDDEFDDEFFGDDGPGF